MDRAFEILGLGIRAQGVDADGVDGEQRTDHLTHPETLHQPLLGEVGTVGGEKTAVSGANCALEVAQEDHEAPLENVARDVLVGREARGGTGRQELIEEAGADLFEVLLEQAVDEEVRPQVDLLHCGPVEAVPAVRVGFSILRHEWQTPLQQQPFPGAPVDPSIGVAAIERACEEADIIIIDEVGKMEVESEAFVKAVRDALETDKPMLLTLHKKSRNPLLQDIRRRDDMRILEVTRVNRPLLTNKIKRLMRGELL